MLHNKSYMNQIEAIRLFSHNIPTDMTIIVKDHPVACGKRSSTYYEKILEIPNVKMVHPGMNTDIIIENSKIILTVAGSVSFEAILKAKPVISLGLDHHNVLPDTMIKMVQSPKDLYQEIKSMLENFKFNKHALISYIASAMKNSVNVNLYSTLLKRPNREELGLESSYESEITKLSNYTAKKILELNIYK